MFYQCVPVHCLRPFVAFPCLCPVVGVFFFFFGGGGGWGVLRHFFCSSFCTDHHLPEYTVSALARLCSVKVPPLQSFFVRLPPVPSVFVGAQLSFLRSSLPMLCFWVFVGAQLSFFEALFLGGVILCGACRGNIVRGMWVFSFLLLVGPVPAPSCLRYAASSLLNGFWSHSLHCQTRWSR